MTVLGGVVAVATVLILGLGYAAWHAVAGLGEDETEPVVATIPDDHHGSGIPMARRDEIAASPMLDVPEPAMEPGGEAEETPEKIHIPAAGVPGPANVLTGFPKTPEGAIAQLAQIDTTVLQSMTLSAARDVYAAWALPGGVGVDNWAITASVEDFLTSSGTSSNPDPALVVTVEPAAAILKGTEGPQWVVGCVLYKVTGSYRSQAQVAFAHCERMQWTGGRWMIAPGRQPAPAPATWPGTEPAIRAGWRTWITDDDANGGHR